MNKIFDFLASVKLTVCLLVILALLSIVGTVIPQQEQPQFYAQKYGESTAKLFARFGFMDMYRSTGFVALMSLLGLNLIVCSCERIPKTWKLVKNKPDLGIRDYANMSFRKERTFGKLPDEWRETVAALLSKDISKPTQRDFGEDAVFFCRKTPWARLGVYVVHGSVLLLFAGAIIGAIWGFKGSVTILEGQTIDHIQLRGSSEEYELGFQVRCDKFTVEFYDTGAPKVFQSDLVFSKDNKETLTHALQVNHPITFEGITFYQSTYGSTLGSEMILELVDNETNEVHTVKGHPERAFSMPDGQGAFRIVDFQSNLRSQGMDFGPGVFVHLMGTDRPGRPFWVVKHLPDLDKRRGGKYTFILKSFQEIYYTGLQANHDPGVWFVYAGFSAMLIGFIITFYLSHRRVWVQVTREGRRWKLIVAGSAHRNSGAFALRMERFWEDLVRTMKQEEQTS